jgi:hypothetical protein
MSKDYLNFKNNILFPPDKPEIVANELENIRNFITDNSHAPNNINVKKANYYLAQCHEYFGNLDEMADCLMKSGLEIGRDSDPYEFEGHFHYSKSFLAHKVDRKHGADSSFLFSYLPKSGSAFICQFLLNMFDLKRCRVSKGMLGASRIVPSWINNFSHGGAANHDHFIASPENIFEIEGAGISKIVVHVRNPLNSLNSFVNSMHPDKEFFSRHYVNHILHNDNIYLKMNAELNLNRQSNAFTSYIFHMSEFFSSWIKYYNSPNRKIEVVFTKYENMVENADEFAKNLMEHIGKEEYRDTAKHMLCKMNSRIKTNKNPSPQIGYVSEKSKEIVDENRKLFDHFNFSPLYDFFEYERNY